jgi:hypothetical protein
MRIEAETLAMQVDQIHDFGKADVEGCPRLHGLRGKASELKIESEVPGTPELHKRMSPPTRGERLD